MTSTVDAVVVGSGFGGAVSACRLAQAGLEVELLERGRRYPAGTFPREVDGLDSGWLWDYGQGLFDIRPLSDVLVVQAAGLGGGSLVYANVQYRPPDDLFAQGWPAGYDRAALDPYYDLVAYMLDINPVDGSQPKGVPPKSHRMQEVAVKLGRSEQFFRPNLAVNFGPPGVAVDNKFGVPQSGCTHCGECDIGCNVHAKNSLDLNYLALAERAGAKLRTQCEATHIEKAPVGFAVHYRDLTTGLPEQIEATRVFVCAGAVNSTELLLRSRDQYGTLPDVSDHLGAGYSANGDFLAFVFETQDGPDRVSDGPTITSALVYDRGSSPDRRWFVLEDGGCPNVVAQLIEVLNPARSALAADLVFDEVRDALQHARTKLTQRLVGSERHRSAVFLAMGRDRADGTISLSSLTETRIDWPLPANLPLYEVEAALCGDVAKAMGGQYVANPGWKLLGQPVSVHNLGGCRMGASAAEAVVNADGEVFGYPGLYVLDGAILPTATGANPSHTIAAVAERGVERAIRRITGDEGWMAPERARAAPRALPEDNVVIPVTGTAPTTTPIVGLRLTETMRGSLRIKGPDGAPGLSLATRFELALTVSDMALFLAEPTHPALAVGTVWVDGLTRPEGAPVAAGTFNLFTLTDGLYQRKMLYHLPFAGPDGRQYALRGYKEVWDHGRFDVWGSTTTLYTSLVDVDDPAGPPVAEGTLRLDPIMFARQLRSFAITGAGRPLGRVRPLGRFSTFFVGTLFDLFVRPKLEV